MAKKRRLSRGVAIVLRTLAGLLVVFGALYAASRTFADVPMSNLNDVFASFSVKNDNKFPYALDASTVIRMAPLDSGVCVLRAGRCEILNRDGKVLQTVQYTYSMPAMDTRNGRVLLYERGGTRYMLLSKTRVLHSGETAEEILTAALADNGRFAIATAEKNAKSLLTVYKSSGKEFFKFKCVSEYVTDISFASGGVAVTVTGVENAEPYSRLLVLNFKETQPKADLRFHNNIFFHVHSSGRTTVACGKSLFTVMKGSEKEREESFESDTLHFFCADEKGRTTMVLDAYGNEYAAKLRGLQANGKAAFEVECDEKILAAARSSSYTAVLTSGAVLTYNNSGTKVGTLTLTDSARDICLAGQNLYVLFYDRLERFPSAGEHTQQSENS